MLDYTFSMIKPDAVERNLISKILYDIESNNFKIEKLRKFRISIEQAKNFYKSLSNFPFYGELCEYISSGDVVGMILRKENAVLDFRELIGATNPAEAKLGSIRKKYGVNKGSNSIHGSDSDESAKIESCFFDL